MAQQSTGGRAVVDALVAAGVDHAFCVPGESFLGVLEALQDEPRIRTIATRHEGGAAFMAAAYGRLTGRPAVCMGTRMVGAGNLAIGIHTAMQDSAPLIALFGQVGTRNRYREAFQEVELSTAFAPIAKWTAEPPAADRLYEITVRAAREAISGRPGPVTLALREELLEAEVTRAEPRALRVALPAPDPAAVDAVLALLRGAERPLLLLGGGVLAAGATADCVRLAEALGVPVMAIYRRPDVFPNDHPLFLGQTGQFAPPCVLERLLAADVLVAVGTRLGQSATHGYRVPGAGTRLAHVDVDARVLGGHRAPAEVACVSDARLFVRALLAAASAAPIAGERRERWAVQTRADRATIERQTTPAEHGTARAGYVDQQTVTWHLRRLLPANAIVCSDAGNFGGWIHRYLRWTQPGTFLAPMSGAMGYGVPAAIAAKLAHPQRPAVTFVGDGGFLMSGTEIETAVREATPIVIVLYDNRQYGTIREAQVTAGHPRPVATSLGPVDFAAFARSLGAAGTTVRTNEDFPAAFEAALRSGRTSLLHLIVDPQQLSVRRDAAE